MQILHIYPYTRIYPNGREVASHLSSNNTPFPEGTWIKVLEERGIEIDYAIAREEGIKILKRM